MTPSLCGSFLVDKRSLIAFTWSLTNVLALVAFVLAVFMMAHIRTHYLRLNAYYTEQYEYNFQQKEGEGEEGEEEERNSQDEAQILAYLQLSAISSKSMTAAALYTTLLAVLLNMYGTTTIVGFFSLRGVYIAPCFSPSGSADLRLGIFGGAIVVFANLLLVCAIVLGEVRVEDWGDVPEGEEMEPYEIERISGVLAVTCMFLAALYTIFAVLLFLYFGNEDSSTGDFYLEDDAANVHAPALQGIGTDPRGRSTAADSRIQAFLGGSTR